MSEPKKRNFSNKVIITCAVTGSIHTPTMSDALPITPEEIQIELDRRRPGLLQPRSTATDQKSGG